MSATPKRTLRILEIETFGRGGLIHYAYNLSTALAERGHEVTLVTTVSYELDSETELPPGVRLEKILARLTSRMGPAWPSFASAIARKVEAIVDSIRVVSLARQLRPDVVHLHCTNPISLAYLELLSRLPGALVHTAHVVTPHEPMPLGRAIYRRIHRLGDLVIAHSEFDRARLREEFEVSEERAVVIPHGEYGFFEREEESPERLEARQRFGLGEGEEVALFFGYIREYKGLDLLLEAWESVSLARPEARLVVAGDPVRLGEARRREAENWAARLGVIHRFDYIPFSDVASYFAAADVLVMPYRHISQSGVLYLGLSLGLPVLATTVGALSEMLSDGESALLVPPEDPVALADALVRLLGNEGLRQRLAEGGRRVALEHSWPSIAAKTEFAFAELRVDPRA